MQADEIGLRVHPFGAQAPVVVWLVPGTGNNFGFHSQSGCAIWSEQAFWFKLSQVLDGAATHAAFP